MDAGLMGLSLGFQGYGEDRQNDALNEHRKFLSELDAEKLELQKQHQEQSKIQFEMQNKIAQQNADTSRMAVEGRYGNNNADTTQAPLDYDMMANNLLESSQLNTPEAVTANEELNKFDKIARTSFDKGRQGILGSAAVKFANKYPEFVAKNGGLQASDFSDPDKVRQLVNSDALFNEYYKQTGGDGTREDKERVKQRLVDASVPRKTLTTNFTEGFTKAGYISNSDLSRATANQTIAQIFQNPNHKKALSDQIRTLSIAKQTGDALEGKGVVMPYQTAQIMAQQTKQPIESTVNAIAEKTLDSHPEIKQQSEAALASLPSQILADAPLTEKKALEKAGGMSKLDSFITGGEDALRGIANFGLVVATAGEKRLPPTEVMRQSYEDNYWTTLAGNMAASTVAFGVAGTGLAAAGITGVLSKVPAAYNWLTKALAVGAISEGIIQSDKLEQKNYTGKYGELARELVTPKDATDYLAYGIPLAAGYLGKVFAKPKPEAVNKMASTIEKDVKTGEYNLVRDIDKEVIKSAENNAPSIKAQALQEVTPEKIQSRDLIPNAKAAYQENIKPMETFVENNQESLSQMVPDYEKNTAVGVLDELDLDSNIRSEYKNQIGKVREKLQGLKSYEDAVDLYRNFNSEYSSDPQSFFQKVAKPIQQDALVPILDAATDGKFGQANRMYRNALNIDEILGLSKKSKKQDFGGGSTPKTKAELISEEMSEKLRKSMLDPKNSELRELVLGDKVGAFAQSELSSVVTKNSRNIPKMTEAIEKLRDSFSGSLDNPEVSNAFKAVDDVIARFEAIDANIGDTLREYSLTSDAAGVDLGKVAEDLIAIGEKHFEPTVNGELPAFRKFTDYMMQDLEVGLNNVGNKYFGADWNTVKSDAYKAVIGDDKTKLRTLIAKMKEANKHNVIKDVISGVIKNNNKAAGLREALSAKDSTLNPITGLMKIAGKIYDKMKAEHHSGAAREAIEATMKKQGIPIIDPEIVNFLNGDKFIAMVIKIARLIGERAYMSGAISIPLADAENDRIYGKKS